MNLQSINNILNSQINNTSDVGRSENTIGADNTAKVLQELINNIRPGSYLQGMILNNDSGNLTLSIGDNTVINARMNTSATFDAGSLVMFSVKSSDKNGITLSPLYTNTDNTSTITKALTGAGLVNDERNITMVSSMMREGMNIGHDELINMAKSLYNIETDDLPDAITLQKLGIEPTSDNISQFHAYLGFEHQVTSAINDIIDLLPETLSGMLNEGDGQSAVTMARDLLDIFTSQGAMEPIDEHTVAVSGLDIPVNEILSGEELSDLANLLNENNIPSEFTDVMQNGGVSLNDTMYVLDNLINKFAEDRESTQSESKQNIISSSDGNVIIQNSESNHSKTTAEIKNSGLDFLQKLRIIDSDLDINITEKEDPVKKLISSKAFSNVIKNAMNAQWKLSPEQVSDDKQVSNLYKRMTEQTSRILEALENQSKQDSPLAVQSNELSKNMNFMNELNNMFNYVQLPMRLSGNDAHGELYVYTNKKNLASKDGNVSALLHLDMDYLGPTDVYVAMNNANHVNTHFYLADDKSLDLIAMHIDELNERLEKRGYSMSVQYTQKDNTTNIMQDIVSENHDNVPISINNFDARA